MLSDIRTLAPVFTSVSCLPGDSKFLPAQMWPKFYGFLAEPHVLDDVEALLHLIEFLRKGDLPWGWSAIPEDTSYDGLREEKGSWSPDAPPLQESLVYARDRQ